MIDTLAALAALFLANDAAAEPNISAVEATASAPDTSSLRAEVEPGLITVIDGDTLRLGEERLRLLDLDTPEPSRYGGAACVAEAWLGDQASLFVRSQIAEAQTVTIAREGVDRFGRTLAKVYVDGENLAALTIEAQLAVPWGGRQHDWCGHGQFEAAAG